MSTPSNETAVLIGTVLAVVVVRAVAVMTLLRLIHVAVAPIVHPAGFWVSLWISMVLPLVTAKASDVKVTTRRAPLR